MRRLLTYIKNTLATYSRLPGLGTNILTTSVLTALYYLIFLPGAGFTDDAQFGGDTWEYQSMAVNLAKGHGVQRWGGMVPFEEYKFDRYDSAMVVDFQSSAGTFHSYRTPIYPIFLGAIYKVFGVSPLIAKKVQLLLLAVIAASLPWVGYHYWKKAGWVSGVIAGFIYIAMYHDRAGAILTEPFFSFTAFLVVIAFIFYEVNQRWLSAAFLGVVTAVSILTKGSLIYVPFLFLLFLLISYFRTRDRTLLSHAAAFLLAFSLTLAPWSVYASIKSKTLVVISTQGENILLDSNNEYSGDGNWHPEWRKTPNANQFYNTDQMQGRFPAFRVINFYLHHPEILPPALKNKLTLGFSTFIFLQLVIVLLLIGKAWQLTMKYSRFRNNSMVFSVVSVVVVMLLLSTHYSLISWLDAATIAAVLLPISFILLFWKEHLIRIPLSFYIFFLNFFILTLLTYGAPRFIEVVDFVFILCGIHASVIFVEMLVAKDSSSELSDKVS